MYVTIFSGVEENLILIYSPVVTEVITAITVCRQGVWEEKLFALAGAVYSNSPSDGYSEKLDFSI